MITPPWDLALAALFALTGGYCLVQLIRRRRPALRTAPRPRRGAAPLSDADIVDVNHIVMSAAMILMLWVAVADVFLWAQVILFAILAISLIPLLVAARGGTKMDLVAHVILDLAMIWMLAAMPLLMAGMDAAGQGTGHPGHEQGAGGTTLTATPPWADAINLAAVAACAVIAAWWVARLILRRGHRLHALCHAEMAGGMTAMLVLMNA